MSKEEQTLICGEALAPRAGSCTSRTTLCKNMLRIDFSGTSSAGGEGKVERAERREKRGGKVPKVCAHCGHWADQVCARCRGIAYCCKAHQKADWRAHKPNCVPLQPEEDKL